MEFAESHDLGGRWWSQELAERISWVLWLSPPQNPLRNTLLTWMPGLCPTTSMVGEL
jgi:hypothetical protein